MRDLHLRRVRRLPKPVIVHILTKKGKGYSPAENDPASFHGVGPFQISDGKMEKFDTLSFTEAFNNTLMAIAEKNNKIMAITAAMSKGTGLDTGAAALPANTLLLIDARLHPGLQTLRVAAPEAVQGASLQEHFCPDAGSVMDGEVLDIEYGSFCGHGPSLLHFTG